MQDFEAVPGDPDTGNTAVQAHATKEGPTFGGERKRSWSSRHSIWKCWYEIGKIGFRHRYSLATKSIVVNCPAPIRFARVPWGVHWRSSVGRIYLCYHPESSGLFWGVQKGSSFGDPPSGSDAQISWGLPARMVSTRATRASQDAPF